MLCDGGREIELGWCVLSCFISTRVTEEEEEYKKKKEKSE